VARAVAESRKAVETIRSLPSTGPAELMVSIGGGLFMKANSPPPDRLMISVGADVVLETDRERALRFQEERVKAYEEGLATIEQQRRSLEAQIASNRATLARLAEKLQRASS